MLCCGDGGSWCQGPRQSFACTVSNEQSEFPLSTFPYIRSLGVGIAPLIELKGRDKDGPFKSQCLQQWAGHMICTGYTGIDWFLDWSTHMRTQSFGSLACWIVFSFPGKQYDTVTPLATSPPVSSANYQTTLEYCIISPTKSYKTSEWKRVSIHVSNIPVRLLYASARAVLKSGTNTLCNREESHIHLIGPKSRR